MPRRARIRIAGVPWHVTQRGHDKQRCFFTPRDYSFYLEQLEELAEKHDCAVHAYVLMTNHVHLLLTPSSLHGVSWLMKELGQRVVQRTNRRLRRSGSLWEGRFRSSVVISSDYLMRCYRYVELNPVRARMVERPGDYPWSSFRANAEGRPSQLVRPHEEFLCLGSDVASRQRAYRELFGTALSDRDLELFRGRTHGGYAIGSDESCKRLSDAIGVRAEPTRKQPPRKD